MKCSDVSNDVYTLAAERYERIPIDACDEELKAACLSGLRAMARNSARYKKTVSAATIFLEELECHVQEWLQLEDGAQLREKAQEKAFAIVESIAAVLREVSLRTGLPYVDEEVRLIDYFQQSGNWLPLDPTVIADYYYVRIPISVMRSFLQSPNEAQHA